MKRLFSLIAAAAFGIVGTQAPIASAVSGVCPLFNVPVGTSPLCTLSGGVGTANASVNTNANKTQWLLSANLFVGIKASLFLLDKDGNTVFGCVSIDTSKDGVGAPPSQCTTGAGVPKKGQLIILA
jgi:hypothetical protein